MEFSQWVDKYRPTKSSEILSNRKAIDKIKKWLDNFRNKKISDYKTFKNGVLLSGPPGIGKTSTAHILLKEAGFDVIEFNASELRTSKQICSKLSQILSGKSIKTLFNPDIRTGVIMDEIDGIESKKECSSTDIIDYLKFETNKYYKRIEHETKKKLKKKEKKTIINKNPIICICNSIDKNLSSLMKEVIHIKFYGPSDNEVLQLLKKIVKNEQLNIDDVILQLIVPHCQNDFRRTIYILELLAFYVQKDMKIDKNRLISLVSNLGQKDIDIGLFQAVDNIFNNYNLDCNDYLANYYADSNFVPYLVQENIIKFIDKNTNNTFSEKLDLCIEYYESFMISQKMKGKLFGNWELADYIGILTTMPANIVMKKAKHKSTLVDSKIDKSALISKYNYRFYNLKYINQISKKLDIDIQNFQTLSILVAKSVFIDQQTLEYTIKCLKKRNLNSKEFQKIVKLSFLFDKYGKQFTKKLQNKIEELYEKY